jgi:hypothetical protein
MKLCRVGDPGTAQQIKYGGGQQVVETFGHEPVPGRRPWHSAGAGSSKSWRPSVMKLCRVGDPGTARGRGSASRGDLRS